MIGDDVIYASHTTPEAPDLNRLIARMVAEKCDYLIIEVSSHSLDLERVAGIKFDIGIFTNLTQDHLDFHHDFESYGMAKSKLFNKSDVSILNADDDASSVMEKASNGDIIYYGIESKNDYYGDDISVKASGITFNYYENGAYVDRISMHLTGYFNVSNALSVLAASKVLGLDSKKTIAGLSQIKAVDGRCQVIDSGGRGFSIILDYSHTPDSLKSTISSVKRFSKAAVITVFGCGGDRDSSKRAIMGQISGTLSDISIITSDNPRSEDPISIIEQIVPGMKKSGGEYIIIENRKHAIKRALQMANKDDIIILAGKGHETYQEINGVRSDFDEKVIVKELLKEMK